MWTKRNLYEHIGFILGALRKRSNKMDWNKLLSKKRLGKEFETSIPRPGRSEFESDVGRIVFSGAFRRLGRKSQVHPLAANDHVHTRLTHTMEVAYVGRSLGKELGRRIKEKLPADIAPDDLGTIVQAACFAHDLGNPPFGHAGEDAMATWFELNGPKLFESLTNDHKRDLIKIEGNAQGFRIIAQTENHLFDGGLQLTYATLGAFHKYPWSSREPNKKFGAYITEEEILEKIALELGLVKASSGNVWCRHPLAHLVEAADDTCYAVLDLEDAVELRIITFDEASAVLLKPFNEHERNDIIGSFGPKGMYRVNLTRLRNRVFDKVISSVIEAYISSYDRIMDGERIVDVFELLPAGHPCRDVIVDAKRLGRDKIYTDIKKTEIEIGSYASFDTMLPEFCNAALNQADFLNDKAIEVALKWKSTHILRLLGDHAPAKDNAPGGPKATWSRYQCLRRVIDFVSGMTDNYAVYVSRQFQGMGFSGVQRP